jgi:hypothetical protein
VMNAPRSTMTKPMAQQMQQSVQPFAQQSVQNVVAAPASAPVVPAARFTGVIDGEPERVVVNIPAVVDRNPENDRESPVPLTFTAPPPTVEYSSSSPNTMMFGSALETEHMQYEPQIDERAMSPPLDLSRPGSQQPQYGGGGGVQGHAGISRVSVVQQPQYRPPDQSLSVAGAEQLSQEYSQLIDGKF